MTRSRFNVSLLFLLALALSIPSTLLAQGGNQNRNRLVPVLIYTVSSVGDAGGTDASNLDVQSALIIYSNGQAVFLGGEDNTAANSVCNVTLGGEQVRNLQRDLRRAGAQRLSSARQGQQGGGEGDTLITVTFFINNQNASQSVANTFTYFTDSSAGGSTDDLGAFGRFESSVQSFLSGNFGSCNGGGSGGFGG